MKDVPASPISDSQLRLELLDTGRSDLRPVVDAAQRGDMDAARAELGRVIRSMLQPERYLSRRFELGDNAYVGPDETIEVVPERILRDERISCAVPHRFDNGIDWTANPTPNGYKEWTWQLNRHREWLLMGELYRRTGDERLPERIVSEFLSWRAQALLPADAPPEGTKCWRTIECGIRMNATWPWALHAIVGSPHLTDEVLLEWLRGVWEHGWRLRHFHSQGNWLTMEMNGLAQIGVLFPVLADAAEWRDYALTTLGHELVRQVYPDGFQYELSTHTHQILWREFGRLQSVLRAYDMPMPEDWTRRLETVHAANLAMVMPDGRLPNLNNGSWHALDELMEDAAEAYPSRADFRWAASRGTKGAPPSVNSLAFPYAGYVVFRSDWSDTAVWALFDGGPYGYRHHHEDKLNLLLHAHGRLLLTEAGKYSFDESAFHRHALSSAGHNTVLVDSHGQNRGHDFRKEEVWTDVPSSLGWRKGATVEVAEAVYDEGYGPDALRSVAHHRRVLFLKELGAFLVVDRLIPRDGAVHGYQALWHMAVDHVEQGPQSVWSEDEGQANLSMLFSRELDLKIARGRDGEDPQGWTYTQDPSGPTRAVPIPTVVAVWQSGGPSRLVTLLWPREPGAVCPVASVEAADEVADTRIRLLRHDSQIIEIDERACLGTPLDGHGAPRAQAVHCHGNEV
ncbi:alginate lyase family protein [Pseudoruegeria sp. HB172150]|uniref:alginate lyase family protein n=1 Tax=Pseudoruegeria sp. HB172150 TaxID=2721164 RepID=UPI001551ECE4|nr:alginate lyase family protein [Pseudoruegeria sp. HB172150]